MEGFFGVKIKNTSNKILSFILSFASGLMISIVCFDLIPEALKTAEISIVLFGIIFGIIIMIICDIIVQNKIENKENRLLKIGIAVAVGLALHNFPEGLAIGSGLATSIKLRLFSSYSNSYT